MARCAVVLSDMTFPPREGLHHQTYLVVRTLAQFFNEIDVTVYVKKEHDLDRAAFARDLGGCNVSVVPYKGSMLSRGFANLVLGRMRRQEREIASAIARFDPDAVHLDGAVAAGLHRLIRNKPGVISWVDPGSRRQFRLAVAANSGRSKHIVAGAAFYLFELLCRSSNKTWHVVSEVDLEYVRMAHPGQRAAQIPVSLPEFSAIRPRLPSASEVHGGEPAPADRDCSALVFADLRVPHLRESFDLLVQNCLIPMSSLFSNVQYVVLGRVEAYDCKSVPTTLNLRFVDWVDELDNFIAGFDFVLLPDQVGTGLKNRTVRVLSAGCAVIGTPQAFEGIAVEPGVHALIASNWTDWLQSISSLVTDTQLRERLAASAPAAATVFDPIRVARRWIDIYSAIPSISPANQRGE